MTATGKGKRRQEQATTVLAIAERPTALRVQAIDLEVIGGPDRGSRANLEKRELSVGSHPSNDLVLGDPAVSRFHFRIVADDVGCLLADTTSTNGTFVNGVRVERAYLFDGAHIQAGNSIALVRLGGGETEIELSAEESFGPAVGRSVAMREVFAIARRAATSSATILILGETGTGKDVLARAIHAHSNRAAGPFVVFDCAATPANLIESALFGHVRGAFTGAEESHPGVFERATGGTLFLDEIGELPIELQPKLLRVLDGGAVTPVGGTRELSVDVRVIAATNRDLRAMVAKDRFRPDLYYRLAVVGLELPSLDRRREDIPLLASHFLHQILERDGQIPPWSPEEIERAFAHLAERQWPGNVRQLRNALERALALADLDELAAGGLESIAALETGIAPAAVSAALPLAVAREQYDRRYLVELLASTDGDTKRAAEIAEVHPKSLERLLRKHKIKKDS
jgi:DNA-binding NtrC family response regulator